MSTGDLTSDDCCCVAGVRRLLGRSPGVHRAQSERRLLLPNRQHGNPMEAYDIGAKIGEGAFGKVYLVTRKRTGAVNVMKVMSRAGITDQAAFDNELEMQMMCDHPHVCKIFDTFDGKEDVHIVLEACQGGSLEDAIEEDLHFGEAEAHFLSRQYLSAICYMHANCIVHRDLKPDNMLLAKKGGPMMMNNLKLVDFGFARQFTPGKKDLETKCGTLHFMAPEIMTDEFFDSQCDMWSAGVILYIFLCGEPPFDDDDDDALLAKAAEGHLPFDGDVWSSVSQKAKLAVMQMCKVDPGHRFTAQAALHSPWQMMDFGDSPKVGKRATQSISKGIRKFKNMSKARKAAAYVVAMNVTEAQQEQMAYIRRKFEELDTDGDGKLSLEEIRDGLESLNLGEFSAEEVFQTMDLHKTGLIEWSEFVSVMVCRTGKDDESMMDSDSLLWSAFRVFDQHNDLQIGAQEAHEVIKRIDSKFTKAEAEAFIKEGDTNGDGRLSFEEFKALCGKVAPKVSDPLAMGAMTNLGAVVGAKPTSNFAVNANPNVMDGVPVTAERFALPPGAKKSVTATKKSTVRGKKNMSMFRPS